MNIGNKIKILRTQKGITQETLAAALGVSPQAVSKWETGAGMPDILLLPELSAYFGITLDALFDLSEEMRMQRIQNMLWDERVLDEQTVKTETAFLLDKAQRDQEDAECLKLLAEIENHQAQTHRMQAAQYARQALARKHDYKDAHGELVAAEGGQFADWYMSTHHRLINWYKAFVAKHPDYARGYLWLMDQLMDDHRFEEAGRYLEQMARVDRSFRVPLYQGHIAWLSGRQEEAFIIWRQMCQDFSKDWLMWLAMGDNLARAGRFEEARQHYRKALDIQPAPKFVDALESIAQLYEREGNAQAAIDALQEELQILAAQWDTSTGETVDRVHREIARLTKLG